MQQNNTAEHYEWEEVILDEASQGEWEGMKKSLCFGLGCTIVSFGMLRWRRNAGVGGMMSKYASSSSSSSSSTTGGYKFDPLPPSSGKANNHQHLHSNFHQNHHHHHHNSGYNHSNNNTRLGFIFDVTLSTILGLGTSLLAIDSDIFYPKTVVKNNDNNNDKQTAASSITTRNNTTTTTESIIEPPPQWISPNIPLVPGRSIIADTLCQPLTQEFRKFPKQLWQSGSGMQRGIENGYNNHMALYANSGWKGTKYYKENENASIVSVGEHGGKDGISTVADLYDDKNNNDGSSFTRPGIYEQLVLDSLQTFIINCERRARHERKIRKIKGIRNNNVPVAIPSPDGVKADEDLELDDIYLLNDDNKDGGYDEDDTGFGL